MRLTKKIADFVFPQKLYCNCCGKYINQTRTYGLCDHCIRHMSFKITDLKSSENNKYFNAAAAAMGYGLYERQLIFGLKYNGHTHLAREIADILYDALISQMAEKRESPWLLDDFIVPVPIHKQKLKVRGFNQTEKIGEHLSKRTGIPSFGNALVRTRTTEAQRGLSASERARNMKDAFEVNPKAVSMIKGKNILLLDDIYTTGATAVSCAETLLEAGAARVDFLALLSAKNRQHEISTCNEEQE